MAGTKKKKKPAANPARGFATTSLPSKPRLDPIEAPDSTPKPDNAKPIDEKVNPSGGDNCAEHSKPNEPAKDLSPEEFEKQLEESGLQLLVEQYAQKVKREAQRQKARFDVDRRLLRGQAESTNTRRWLPPELLDEILELIQSEARFAPTSTVSESSLGRKQLSEDDLIVKLWTLQMALSGSTFSDEVIKSVLNYVLEIAPRISATNKDSVWGLDEALDWLSRECSLGELPDYDRHTHASLKPQGDTPTESPLASGATTPLLAEFDSQRTVPGVKSSAAEPKVPRKSTSKKLEADEDGEIDPEDLIPAYVQAQEKLFKLQRSSQYEPLGGSNDGSAVGLDAQASKQREVRRLLARLERIENDVLFDKYPAEQQWRPRKIALEREAAVARKDMRHSATINDDSVNEEAERVAADMLREIEDDDTILADLFSSLPMSEVDADTGKSRTVINGKDGDKIVIRDFGKWTGLSPVRILEEACRSRDSSAKLAFRLVSDASYASRHALHIVWTKSQDLPAALEVDGVEAEAIPTHFAFKMTSIATPEAKQSEAFIATVALFSIFGSSSKEEKLALKLPATWKDLWDELAESKRALADASDRVAVKVIRDMVRKRREQELEDGIVLQAAFKGRGVGKNGDVLNEPTRDPAKSLSGNGDQYRRIWTEKAKTQKFQMMLQSRAQLPMWAFKDKVLEATDREQVVIICGETGCGKSTQVPSFLLEHQLLQGNPCKIYCTEPRRISAISLARRVSEELGENRGDLGTSRSLVGYSIRLEANTSRESRLIYATTGIVLRMLEGSNDLEGITHLVLDEVHERSIDSDFLLIVLKKLMQKRTDLKVVLMSATVDAERFSKYLSGAPVLNVPGRTFPVQALYLEDAVQLTGYTVDQAHGEPIMDLEDDLPDSEGDGKITAEAAKTFKQYSPRTRATLQQLDEYRIEFDLIVQLVAKIATEPDFLRYSKAILIFLPGLAEIRQLIDLFLGDKFFSSSWVIYPLHSTIATEDQEAAFLVPPPGVRKIVLATNIAETGITIPDVTCVIDTGKHREMRFDERRQLSRLVDTFISRANAKQRRGRAGRVQEGLCFHLFTKHRHDTLMSDQQTPEMLRLSLQDLAMRVKICQIGGIEETLTQALDPPSTKNIRRAVDALVDVRALTPAEELTPLGVQLARLPLDVFLGKLILLGTVFKCLDMAVTASAILSSKSPFVAPFGQRTQADAARLAFRRGDSDVLTVYNAYLAWKRVCQSAGGVGQEFQFCRKNFLSAQTLANIEDLKGQLVVALADSNFLALTDDERRNLLRVRSSHGAGAGRRRHQTFLELPYRANLHSENDDIAQSVIAWSFYPKLLIRDVPGGKGLRNVGNNQTISLHPSSVNKGHNEIRWLSYYHIMQSKAGSQSKSFYNAHETTAVDAFAIALLCGDVRYDMHAGVIVLDGNRARFALPDWKTMLAMKMLRTRLREMLTRAFKSPGKMPTVQHERWLDVWQNIFTADERKDQARANDLSVKLG